MVEQYMDISTIYGGLCSEMYVHNLAKWSNGHIRERNTTDYLSLILVVQLA